MTASWCGQPLPDDRDGWKTRALAFRESAEEARAEVRRLRPALAEIVGAFTSGIYCASCGESLDDGCVDDCVIGKGRRALTGEPEILGGR